MLTSLQGSVGIANIYTYAQDTNQINVSITKSLLTE